MPMLNFLSSDINITKTAIAMVTELFAKMLHAVKQKSISCVAQAVRRVTVENTDQVQSPLNQQCHILLPINGL